MLTIQQIQEKVNQYPSTGSVEGLLKELLMLYKIENGLKDIENGDVEEWEDVKKQLETCIRSK
jgi:hypothetical protein